MNKCIGCGIKLQDKDQSLLGYTPKINNKYCERCFKLIHYNQNKEVINLDNKKIVDKINKLNYFTIFITDLLSINKRVIDIYKSIKNNKILIVNKCDIIPNNVKLEHLEDNIKNSYNIKEDVYFISAKKKMYLNKIINLIEENNNVIFCGETSSGKSTLINNLIDSKLTTSKYNNTTLDFIKLKYLNYIIYDTPGFINESNNDYDNIIIKTKDVSDNYVLNIGDLIIKTNGNLTFYINDNTNIISKKENVNLPNRVDIKTKSDIVLNNGFIYVKEGITVYSNKELEIRNSIIGK
jgi:ribosome biogenesis GTPase A